jgi:hypothetical protein
MQVLASKSIATLTKNPAKDFLFPNAYRQLTQCKD